MQALKHISSLIQANPSSSSVYQNTLNSWIVTICSKIVEHHINTEKYKL